MNMYIQNGPFVLTILGCLFRSIPAIAGEYSREVAPNAPGQRFGECGELAISGDTQLSLAHSWISIPGGMVAQGTGDTQLRVAPSADYFVLHGLSLGARVSYVYQAFEGIPAHREELSLGPSVGYNVALGKYVSFWPDVYVTLGGAWDDHGSAKETTLSIGGSAPLLYHPAAHFFLGFGPSFVSTVVARISNSQGSADTFRPNELGVAATVGGWVGL